MKMSIISSASTLSAGLTCCDLRDIASMLTHYFQDRGFLAPDEKLDPFGIVDLFDKTGYYLTVERKNGEIKIRWDSK